MSRTLLLIVLLAVIIAACAAWLLLRSPAPSVHIPASDRGIPESPYWAETDRWIDVDGVATRVRIDGPLDARPVVLVHGFSHSLESWDAWAEALSQDHLVIRYDLPGHALTGPDPQRRYTVSDTVDHLAGLLDALQLEQTVLVGNSLGGLVSWRLAARQPSRVSSLVLLAPGGYSINGVTEEPVPVPMAVSFFLTQAPQPLITAGTQALYGNPAQMDAQVPVRVYDLMREPGVGQALVERLEVFILPDPQGELARVTAPTLILWGQQDAMIPAEHAGRFEADMPRARAILYPELGHVVQEEDPETTLADVREFLAEN